MGAGDNKTAVEQALEALNAGDLDGYMDLYDSICTAHGFAPEAIPVEGLRAFYGGLLEAFPDTTVTVEQMIAAGDVVVVRYTFRGTHEGEFAGVPASGRPVVMSGHTSLRFGGDRVVERWQNADVHGLLVQIGAITAPA